MGPQDSSAERPYVSKAFYLTRRHVAFAECAVSTFLPTARWPNSLVHATRNRRLCLLVDKVQASSRAPDSLCTSGKVVEAVALVPCRAAPSCKRKGPTATISRDNIKAEAAACEKNLTALYASMEAFVADRDDSKDLKFSEEGAEMVNAWCSWQLLVLAAVWPPSYACAGRGRLRAAAAATFKSLKEMWCRRRRPVSLLRFACPPGPQYDAHQLAARCLDPGSFSN